ncbi:helix-turn-helix transcriptional regulator [Psychrobacter pygoscelis]|uniref:helix-turn-helix transcriptional regulator n=1 Tax=Psychrobacter pygoscelis TaxID=2488563 RepID=UPI00103EF069|nr:hypothetical protein [Psychrobacter pygoscelis]
MIESKEMKVSASEERRVRIKEFSKRLGRSRATFDRWVKSGKIPKPDGRDPYPYWLLSSVNKIVTGISESEQENNKEEAA